MGKFGKVAPFKLGSYVGSSPTKGTNTKENVMKMTLQERINKNSAKLENMREEYKALGEKIKRKADYVQKLTDEYMADDYQKYLSCTFETADWDYILDENNSPFTRKYVHEEYAAANKKFGELFGYDHSVRIANWHHGHRQFWKGISGIYLNSKNHDTFVEAVNKSRKVFPAPSSIAVETMEIFDDGRDLTDYIVIDIMTEDLSESGIVYLFAHKTEEKFVFGKLTYGMYKEHKYTEDLNEMADWMIAKGHVYGERQS